ncbi:Oidioi.mRNA.OKI2018_I69.XSR.g14428.t1.cds [Oikopleura dioica]|uniref:Oidioi.mRNA.OKI2018_I69.XSR.g14428.t1.cds n=1 Tax=Oikopleura dioica TaxID=34765 RepID=A0ABN7SH20_OIKDI|nr:Oidioi.mRNA.OKI2018_I69.XSR.g14428.t1.cds [Oikopleura dioica]
MKLAVFVIAAASAKRVARQADDAVANETAEYDDYGERKLKGNKANKNNYAPASGSYDPAPAATYPAANNYPANNYPAGNNYPASNYPTQTGYSAPAYPTSPLKCWHCDAMSFEECEAKGMEKTCHPNEGSCFLEIRERRQNGHAGPFMQICMGCKSKDACDNMQNQNFQNQNPAYTQCRPENYYGESVCRQCCASDNCTKEPSWWYPADRSEWAYKGEESGY